MKIAHLSEKGQITIPADVRKRLGLRPGDRIEVMVSGGSIILRPIPPISAVAGIFRDRARGRGADWEKAREETQRAIARKVAEE